MSSLMGADAARRRLTLRSSDSPKSPEVFARADVFADDRADVPRQMVLPMYADERSVKLAVRRSPEASSIFHLALSGRAEPIPLCNRAAAAHEESAARESGQQGV